MWVGAWRTPVSAPTSIPSGVLYNPESIALALTALLDGLPPDSYFCDAGGVWHSWLHSGAFSAPTQEDCRARVEPACCPPGASWRRWTAWS